MSSEINAFKFKVIITIFILCSLCINTFVSAPALKLVDLPGIDQRSMDESMVSIKKGRSSILVVRLAICATSRLPIYAMVWYG
jgi:hypothetical protein